MAEVVKGEGKKKKKSFKGEWGHVHACKATRYIEMVHSQIFSSLSTSLYYYRGTPAIYAK